VAAIYEPVNDVLTRNKEWIAAAKNALIEVTYSNAKAEQVAVLLGLCLPSRDIRSTLRKLIRTDVSAMSSTRSVPLKYRSDTLLRLDQID
jgi:hypothetical protein